MTWYTSNKNICCSVLFGVILLVFSPAAYAAESAKNLGCAVEGVFRSMRADSSTEIVFMNVGHNDKSVYWLDYSGKRVFYRNLAPGESYSQQTFVTHPWVITSDDNGTCEALFLPRSTPSAAILK